MFIKILINYILGYINIIVEGYYIERFINICISRKILIWNLKREKSSILKVNVGIRDFKKIREIAKKTKCRIKIQNKKGIPFLLNKYKKRKVFAVLLIVTLFMIIVVSNFVWNIDVIGTDKIQKEELIKDLNECGLEIGKKKSNINTKEIINNIRLKREDIAWIGINLKGTNAIVEVVEAKSKPNIINEDELCNIVATKEGIITKINSQNGTSLVKIGDLVKKGDILIGGWLEGKYTGTRYVHAKGEVEARVWYTKKQIIDLNYKKRTKTGNAETKYSVSVNNFQINFYKRLPKYENYDTICDSKKLKIFSNFYIPIELRKTTYEEVQEEYAIYDIDEAKNIAIDNLSKELEDEIENKDKIINKQINCKEDYGKIDVEVIYEVLENIETNEKIVF